MSPAEASARRPGSAARLLLAFLRKDLLIFVSYKTWFLSQVMSIGFTLLTLFFLSRLFEAGSGEALARYGSRDYFAFAVVGMALLDYMWVALRGFAGRIRELQMLGILEDLFLSPWRPEAIVVNSAAFSFGWNMLRTVATILTAHWVFGDLLSNTCWLSAALVWLLAVLVFTALGLFGAGITLLLKTTDPITGLFGGLSFLFGGVLYPVEVMPELVASVARFIPMTLASTGLRRALLGGATPGELGTELLGLLIYVVVLFPAAWAFLRWSVRLLRKEGAVGNY
jgi:ABC-2 type transport system permease protein